MSDPYSDPTVHFAARLVSLPDSVPWPTICGMRGSRLKFSQIVEMGERVRGASIPFTIDYVKVEDLERGVLDTSWSLTAKHKAAEREGNGDAMLKQVAIGMLLSAREGAWDVGNEANVLFQDFEFESVEKFLGKVWKDRQRSQWCPTGGEPMG